MARRLILFDVIPLFVSWPLPPVWTALALVRRSRKYDELGEIYVHVDGQEGHPPHRALVAAALTLRDGVGAFREAIGAFLTGFGKSAKVRFNAVGLRGHETRGRGFLFRYLVSEYCDEVGRTLGGEGGAEDVEEAKFDEMVEVFEDVLGFGGHVTRDQGLSFWESERGPEKFMLTKWS